MLKELFFYSFILGLSIYKTISSFSQGEEPRGPMIGVVLLFSREDGERGSSENYLSNQVDNLKGIEMSFNNNCFKEK